jgi:hypothetical protein
MKIDMYMVVLIREDRIQGVLKVTRSGYLAELVFLDVLEGHDKEMALLLDAERESLVGRSVKIPSGSTLQLFHWIEEV